MLANAIEKFQMLDIRTTMSLRFLFVPNLKGSFVRPLQCVKLAATCDLLMALVPFVAAVKGFGASIGNAIRLVFIQF